MKQIENIKNILNNEEFSMQLVNDCKLEFQFGGFDDSDIDLFRELLSINVKKTLPNLTDLQIKQIAQVCIDRGIYNSSDILFLDGCCYDICERAYGNTVDALYVTDKYKRYDFRDFTFFFRNNGTITKDKEFLARLREELNEFFIKYYDIDYFPKELGLDYGPFQYFFIKFDKDEVINGLNNDIPFNISIICNHGIDSEKEDICLTKLTYNPNSEQLIDVLEVNDKYVRLSDLIKNKENNYQYSKIRK